MMSDFYAAAKANRRLGRNFQGPNEGTTNYPKALELLNHFGVDPDCVSYDIAHEDPKIVYQMAG